MFPKNSVCAEQFDLHYGVSARGLMHILLSHTNVKDENEALLMLQEMTQILSPVSQQESVTHLIHHLNQIRIPRQRQVVCVSIPDSVLVILINLCVFRKTIPMNKKMTLLDLQNMTSLFPLL